MTPDVTKALFGTFALQAMDSAFFSKPWKIITWC